ncbi:1556_t:CDS:1, partial [Acaulospora colombiana]
YTDGPWIIVVAPVLVIGTVIVIAVTAGASVVNSEINNAQSTISVISTATMVIMMMISVVVVDATIVRES